jgi:hypothetical protein
VKELAMFHYSYLNRDYSKAVLGKTKDPAIPNDPNPLPNTWMRDGCFATAEQKLGYRLSLVSSEFPTTPVTPGTEFTAKITIHNSGWAAPINPHQVILGLRRKDGLLFTTWRFTGKPPKEWHPGTFTLTQNFKTQASLPAGTYELLLYLPDPYSSRK